mgnify:CR=1 FL=1
MKQPQRDFCGNTSRREFIQTVSGGFAKLALTGMLAKEGILGNSLEAATASLNPLLPRPSISLSKRAALFSFSCMGAQVTSILLITNHLCMVWMEKRFR